MKYSASNNLDYNKNLKHFAKANRNSSTKVEACLWKYALSKKQMRGYAFKRQRPVLTYISDFLCQELKLIIEVDGITHQSEVQYKKDVIRQRKLEEAGFTIIRFSDEEVLESMDDVIRAESKIMANLATQESSL